MQDPYDLKREEQNKKFGLLVKALRQERVFYDRDGNMKVWTQAKLAEETAKYNEDLELSSKIIADIEQGKIAHLSASRHLEPLCYALKLSAQEKIEFYAVAGQIYEPTQPTDPKLNLVQWAAQDRMAQLMLKKHAYPVFLMTPVGDIVAFNSTYTKVYQLSDKHITLLKDQHNPLGSNILRLYFDEAFNRKALRGGDAHWRAAVLDTLWTYRRISFRYIATKRYKAVISELLNQYPEFKVLWHESLTIRSSADPIVKPGVTVYYLKETLEFTSLQMPKYNFERDVYCNINVPFDDSEVGYQNIRKKADEKVYYFDVEEV